MTLVFDESYGTLSYAQRAAYRKYNVSPCDHDQLLLAFREEDHRGITKYVKDNSPNGYFVAGGMIHS
jgi:hypothetical protein